MSAFTRGPLPPCCTVSWGPLQWEGSHSPQIVFVNVFAPPVCRVPAGSGKGKLDVSFGKKELKSGKIMDKWYRYLSLNRNMDNPNSHFNSNSYGNFICLHNAILHAYFKIRFFRKNFTW